MEKIGSFHRVAQFYRESRSVVNNIDKCISFSEQDSEFVKIHSQTCKPQKHNKDLNKQEHTCKLERFDL